MVRNYITLLLCFFCVYSTYSQNYETDVLPILEVNCAGCHGFGGGPLSGGLDLTTQEGVLAGATSGPVVVFGDFENSVLYQEANAGTMPPSSSGNPNLTEVEVAIIASWIQGLNDGCTDDTPGLYPDIFGNGGYAALNYDPNAINDDGSCEYAPWEVINTDCNMTIAIPGDLVITLDGVDVTEPIWLGVANGDDIVSGLVLYTPGETTSIAIFGASGGDPGMAAGEELNWIIDLSGLVGVATVVNYNEMIGSGTYSCNGLSQITLLTAVSEQIFIDGCIDPIACNYNENATVDDGSCIYIAGACDECSGETDGSGVVIDGDADDDGVCDVDEIIGCTDEASCTYNENATDDDGSCQYLDNCGVCGGDDTACLGCSDGGSTEDGDGIVACNYGGASITIDDGSCEYESCSGCMDEFACNFSPLFTIENNAECDYSCLGCIDGGDTEDGDGIVACNYDPDATQDDGSCEYISCVGCTDSEACNYNPDSEEDDGSCEYTSCVGCLDPTACNYEPSAEVDCYLEGQEFEGFTYLAALNNSSYYVSDVTYSWTDANNLCNLSGGTLVVLDSQEESDFIGSLNNIDPNEPYWIGVFQNINSPDYFEPDGGWELVTGEELIYENWQIGEPNETDSQAENYVTVQFNFGWNDAVNADIENIGTPWQAILEVENCCEYVDDICETCEDGVVIDNDEDDDEICDDDEIPGCTDATACNYNENATDDDGNCIYVNLENECGYCSGETDGTGTYVVNDSDSDGLCDECNEDVSDCEVDPCPNDPDNDTNNNGVWDCEEITGCTDPDACNFDPAANVDDLTCFYPDGCTEPGACNYDPNALCDDESCILPDGCTNPNSCNYDPDALCDDGSCSSLSEDDSCLICTDPVACNYTNIENLGDDEWYIENNSICTYDVCCDDPSATNYDPDCTCPDQTACFTVQSDCGNIPGCDDVVIFPIPITSSYGPYQISCDGESDGVLGIDFNTMNLASSGQEPYLIDIWIQEEYDDEGNLISPEEFIGTLDGLSPEFTNLSEGTYILYAYDQNGCCQQTQVDMNAPNENYLEALAPDQFNILCPGGETEIDFIITGDVGQFDILIDGVLFSENESIEGGTVDIDTDDIEPDGGDGIPDGFVQLSTDLQTTTNTNFWPDINDDGDPDTNDCETSQTIYINIEDGSDIDDGDLLGAFYTTSDGGLQCFGYNEYVSTGGSSLVTIQICEGDYNGFYDGEEVIFLLYDESDGLIYEVEVTYEYNNTFGVFTDVFSVSDDYDGIWITSLSIVGVTGSVPDFTLTAIEGSYNISIYTTGDSGVECLVVDTIIDVFDPDDMFANLSSGGLVCNYFNETTNTVESEPTGEILLDEFGGGTSPYTYTWTNSVGEVITQSLVEGVEQLVDEDLDGVFDDLSFLEAGIYTLSVEDGNGCPYETTLEIIGSDTYLNEPTIEYAIIPCLGGITTVSVGLDNLDMSPYIFVWENSDNEILFSSEDFNGFVELADIEAGNYTITITDLNECVIETDFEVDFATSIGFELGGPLIEKVCGEEDAYVNFMDCDTDDGSCIANGTPPYNYTWWLVNDDNSNGVLEFPEEYSNIGWVTPDATLLYDDDGDLVNDTYSMIVTDGSGCEGEYIFNLIPPEPIDFEYTVDPIECYGDDATISLELVSGNPGLYNITFEGETTTITIGGESDLDFCVNVDPQTSVNQTLVFMDDAASIFNTGDIVAVFYQGDNGFTCGGSLVYNNETIFNIPVWEDDNTTPEDDGFIAGEPIFILVNSGGLAYLVDVLEYNLSQDPPNNYIPNGMSVITNAVIGDEFIQGANFITGPLSEGSYFIEVIDGNQCSWDALVEIEGVPEYGVSSAVINPSCYSSESGSITLDIFGGTPPYSFIWSGPEGFSFQDLGVASSTPITDLNPGEYSVIVFDNSDCDPLVEFFPIVIDTPEPDEISYTNELCGSDGVVSACVSWEGDITFVLNQESVLLTGEGGQLCWVFDELVAGNYVLSISSSDELTGLGCSYEQDIVIEATNPIILELNAEDAQCYGGTGSVWIEVLEGGNEPLEQDWQGVNTASVLAGEHQLTITDANGCSESYDYYIDEPDPVDIAPYPYVGYNTCFGNSIGIIDIDISGGAEGYAYQVYNSNNLEESVLDASGSSINLGLLGSGSYELFIEDANGCIFVFDDIIIEDVYSEILFENASNQNTTDGVWELNSVFMGECYGDDVDVYINVIDVDNLDFSYDWYELENGEEGDWDGDGDLNDVDFNGITDDTPESIGSTMEGEEFTLQAGYYYVIVESSTPGNLTVSCLSDTLLFEVETPSPFEINVDDILLDCYGDVTSVSVIITGGSDEDIDGDEIVNWLDLDIDGDGEYNANGDCISNCNDDDSGQAPNNDIDIDNDMIPNAEDDYIGGTIYNSLSTDYHPEFSNGPIFDKYDNELEVWVEEIDPNILSAGQYRVSATDSHGCESGYFFFTIAQPPLLLLGASYDYNAEGDNASLSLNENIPLRCPGDIIAIIAEPSGGTPPYTIIGPELLSEAGSYIIDVYDSSQCHETFSFSVSGPPPALSFESIGLSDWGGLNISCNGEEDGSISIVVSGGTPMPDYEYSWIGPNNFTSSEQNITNLSAGEYIIEVTDVNDCFLTETIILNEPDVFSIDSHYIINASCDEESDGMIIIRTNGGNPPLQYVFQQDTLITIDSLFVIYEDDYNNMFEEVLITESDILITNLSANMDYTNQISILSDEYLCVDPVVYPYPLEIESDDIDCLFIPSIFTPNADGINDTWEIDGIDLYSNVSVQVFNRWGQLIYESEGEYIPWDGVSQASKKSQAIATYYYVINLNTDDKTYNGSVTIKR